MVGAFARGIALGAKNDLAAAETLADKVIGQSFEDEPHTRDGKSTKRLACYPLQFDLDGRRRFTMVQAFQRDLARYAGADRAVTVCGVAALIEKGLPSRAAASAARATGRLPEYLSAGARCAARPTHAHHLPELRACG